jgi:hypothetical protein
VFIILLIMMIMVNFHNESNSISPHASDMLTVATPLFIHKAYYTCIYPVFPVLWCVLSFIAQLFIILLPFRTSFSLTLCFVTLPSARHVLPSKRKPCAISCMPIEQPHKIMLLIIPTLICYGRLQEHMYK